MAVEFDGGFAVLVAVVVAGEVGVAVSNAVKRLFSNVVVGDGGVDVDEDVGVGVVVVVVDDVVGDSGGVVEADVGCCGDDGGGGEVL